MIDRMDDNFDELLHPANAFEHPSEVVNDIDLTLNEKRAILASWASDACAIEAAPELRARPQGSAVRFEEIMEALRTLDKQANGDKYRRVLHRPRIFRRTSSAWPACAIEAAPELRARPQGSAVRFEEIMEAHVTRLIRPSMHGKLASRLLQWGPGVALAVLVGPA